jgi:pimeloyl-ACP methyl ester carboxylesterase
MPFLKHQGHRLAYTSFGEGPRTCVFVHGLLLSQKMHRALALELAARGNRVLTIDVLGHGRSDRPRDLTQYSMPIFGGQIVALLDHLEIEDAVIGGTSLGANAALEVADLAPDRVRGLVIEMPVLDNALLACALVFTPLLVALTFGAPVMRVVAAVARRLPTADGPALLDLALDTVRQDPDPSSAVLQGLFFGRTAPPKDRRRLIEAPALIIGHDRDPVHPFSDADALLDELRDARLLRADSILELRLEPERLTGEIAAFLDECWLPRRAESSTRPPTGRRRRVA